MNRRFPLFGGNDNSYVILSDNILSGFRFLGGFTGGAVCGNLFTEFCAADFAEQIGDVFEGGVHERFGALVLAQNLDAGFVADAWHFEPFDFEVFFAFATLVRNSKSVRLVASVLQKL